MNNDTPADAITQADRLAAADLIEAYWSGSNEGMMKLAKSYRAGHSHGAFVRAFAKHRAKSLAAQDGLVDALRYARSQIVGLAVSGTDRIDELCRRLQNVDPSPIWPIPFPDPPERTWQPIVKRIDEALASIEVKS